MRQAAKINSRWVNHVFVRVSSVRYALSAAGKDVLLFFFFSSFFIINHEITGRKIGSILHFVQKLGNRNSREYSFFFGHFGKRDFCWNRITIHCVIGINE